MVTAFHFFEKVAYGSSRFVFLLILFLVRFAIYLLLTKRLGGTDSTGEPIGVDIPGSFATNCCRPGDDTFAHVSAGCSSDKDGGVFVSGFSTEFIDADPNISRSSSGDAAKILQRVSNMKMYHCVYNHCSLEKLNDLVRSGKITDGIILNDLRCPSCEMAKLLKKNVSKTHAKSHVSKVLHTVQGDIFDAEDVKSWSGFKYICLLYTSDAADE